MSARLAVLEIPETKDVSVGTVFPLERGVRYAVGRPPDACGAARGAVRGLLFRLDGLSRITARLDPVEDTWLVRDAGSTHGTFVNDENARSGIRLRDGDELRFGDILRFRFTTG